VVFRRGGEDERDDVVEEDDDGLNISSFEDEDPDEPEDQAALFEAGQQCDLCGAEEGRVGIDPTCRGAYDGRPVLAGWGCLERALKDAYGGIEGIAVIVESFGEYADHLYYRLDEMPAYQFVRDDTEAISWLLLTIGDTCARCGEQSRFAWLSRDFVDARLPENEPVFKNLDRDIEHLCTGCTAAALARSYRSLELPLMTVEVPRSAMGILMPAGD
jgi:hypothetical protein